MAGSEDDIPPPPPPPSQTPTQQTPHTVSTIKLPILKKGEYDIWAMKMEHYLAHTDYPIWEVIQRGNGPKVNPTTPIMTFLGIEDHEMFSIIYEPVYGIIYKNSKKEKRVMRHSETHKFCDATLNRVLEGLKSYNNDIKYGYVQKDLTKEETEYLKLFEEEIEERLKHRRQMRRWEMFVNGRPLGPRREHPE
ncbi:hypothetical protein Tco_1375592 [Tanacetum coccineum]